MSKPRADENGCLPDSQAHTITWFDTSVPVNDSQQRAIDDAFEETYKALTPTEQWTLVTTERDHFSAVGGERFTLCALDHGSNDPAYIAKKTQETYDEIVKPRVDKALAALTSQDQRSKQSPALEAVQGISYRPEFSGDLASRRLVIISDMIQVTNLAQFCQTEGHLPSYKKFKTRPLFEKIKPASLQGVEVTIFFLARPAYGQPDFFPYCTENELRDFWQGYFKDAGATKLEIRRVPWTAL